jgi:hypothetical protein
MHPLDAAWQSVATGFEAALQKAAETARVKVSEELNQVARRLNQFKTESDWYDAVLDGAARFASEVVLFAVQGDLLSYKGSRGLSLPLDTTTSFEQAAAFKNARDSRELVVALCRAGEISEPLASHLTVDRGYIFPIANGSRVAALLFASATEATDVNALELVLMVAAAVLERQAQTPVHVQIQSATRPSDSGGTNAPAAKKQLAGAAEDSNAWVWNGLPDSERVLHVRARRFARAKVAEMQLYRPEACRSGRDQQNLYLFLSREVDQAREVFRNQFMTIPSMVDYLHRELASQLAENDELLLGADYPGQMV